MSEFVLIATGTLCMFRLYVPGGHIIKIRAGDIPPRPLHRPRQADSWESMPVILPAHFAFSTEVPRLNRGLAAKFTFLIDTETCKTWGFADSKMKKPDETEHEQRAAQGWEYQHSSSDSIC